jgi:ribosomal protein L37AE/L43A
MNTAKKPICPKCGSSSVYRNSKGIRCKKCGFVNDISAELRIVTYGEKEKSE